MGCTFNSARVTAVLDRLYRRYWWIAAALCVLGILTGSSIDGDGPVGWLLCCLAVLLLGLPGTFRWFVKLREARQVFRDELGGK